MPVYIKGTIMLNRLIFPCLPRLVGTGQHCSKSALQIFRPSTARSVPNNIPLSEHKLPRLRRRIALHGVDMIHGKILWELIHGFSVC